MKVKDCMCHNVACVTPESTVKDCAKIMCNNHVGCIPVCDNTENVVGLVYKSSRRINVNKSNKKVTCCRKQ